MGDVRGPVCYVVILNFNLRNFNPVYFVVVAFIETQ